MVTLVVFACFALFLVVLKIPLALKLHAASPTGS